MVKKRKFNRGRPGKYQRAEPDVFNDEPTDGVGLVRIYVRAIDPANNSVKRGNISRSFTARGTRVSTVADEIERALFHEKA